MTPPADELLRRFLLHLLPKGFVRIHSFGFLANRRRGVLLPVCFRLLGSVPPTSNAEDSCATEHAVRLWTRPQCGGPMILVMRLSTVDILLRSPHATVVVVDTAVS